ncbi:hypothetical protein F8O01_07855 [Pseudoclavibacter chungangensis]|uniref:PH domain-containing protein n=1 Tax=Pseudoclavibacter chungangensis TaxID=587635 RepID=A0A7J5BWJ8_9MICO|nr:hypothetical protein [Pseudoclavibacter chungangensis]KAB1657849.1 hypothetical protein F8O01_07855 [Pseudoclavibacter chungangensis]NYJ66551.1 hypothetical protein [Pseudoclavibacter chungangensis]
MELDPKVVTALILFVAVVVFTVLALVGWRSRRRAQAGVPTPLTPPAGPEPTDRWDDVHYVATSEAARPLERITVPPLAYRGRAELALVESGLAVRVRGADPFLIPADAIVAVDGVTATIDRVVERGGLSAVRWRLGGDAPDAVEVETTFRIVDRDDRERFRDRLDALVSIAPPEENR